MKKIVLFCSQGMSTSLLVNKMEKVAEKEGYDCKIEAHNLASLSQKAPDADIILLGPQIRFNEKKIKKQYPEKKVMVIDMLMYGRMDGKGVLESAKKLLGD
ncbi:PTS sugar transporter subunit IIB [Sporosalibacterium faouarense]|uniref:PTS sugar transporter subunit IIB n=1 Tax=Sporosalibacterium faouarense TaxID=516123 RepID=UPI00141CCE22|nr:PTS sugar transporter subunit IIB [Sporosalibacterium faouarense]MTI49310.1 PTS sugar transporter subunit IIB [Bacillota bacterium]